MTNDERRRALKTANIKRQQVAELRKRLRGNRELAAEILRDPPEEAKWLAVAEVLVLVRSGRGWRSPGVRNLGSRAVKDRVNLLMPLGEASCRTREWAASEGLRWTRQEQPTDEFRLREVA